MYKAQAAVATPKASRYLKALCNHFSHKVTAEYTESQGKIQFGAANCVMNAQDDTLVIEIQSEQTADRDRIKQVMASHLERFAPGENLVITWVDQA